MRYIYVMSLIVLLRTIRTLSRRHALSRTCDGIHLSQFDEYLSIQRNDCIYWLTTELYRELNTRKHIKL